MKDYPNGINVICDIAGQYDALMGLLDQMPKDAYVLAVGDIIDRGSKSKEVVEFIMDLDKKNTGKCLLGNHEHMMLDYYDQTGYYEQDLWVYNGGYQTINSFNGRVPNEVLNWVNRLPLYKKFGDILVSHSFIPFGKTLEEACQITPTSKDYDYENIIWTRGFPMRQKEYSVQIAGHNSQFGYHKFSDQQGTYAICIDSSRNKVLTGIHIPSMIVYQQPYLPLER